MKKIASLTLTIVLCLTSTLAYAMGDPNIAGNAISSNQFDMPFTDGQYIYINSLKIDVDNLTVENINSGSYSTYSDGRIFSIDYNMLWDMNTEGKDAAPYDYAIMEDFKSVNTYRVQDGYIYYSFGPKLSDQTRKKTIFKVSTDGQERIAITDIGLSDDGAETIIPTKDWIYYTDYSVYHEGLYRVSQDGKTVEQVLEDTPLTYAVVDDVVYATFFNPEVTGTLNTFYIIVRCENGNMQKIGDCYWSPYIYALDDRLYFMTATGVESMDYFGQDIKLICEESENFCPVKGWIYTYEHSAQHLHEIEGDRVYEIYFDGLKYGIKED